jgi:hypothetical protein
MGSLAQWILQNSDPMLSACVIVLGWGQWTMFRSLSKTQRRLDEHVANGVPHVRCGLEVQRHEDLCERMNEMTSAMRAITERIDRWSDR